MTYKLIALDLDGTLKSSKKQILPKTKAILQELAKKGIVIVLASGRPTAGMYNEANELELDKLGGYLLSFNGAKVINYQNKEIIYQNVYDASIAHNVYDRAKEFNLAAMTYTDELILTEDDYDEYVLIESDINHMPIKHVDDFKVPFEDTLSIYRSTPFFIEVMGKNIDKAASLQRLIEHLGIKQDEVICFGDGYNDLTMIKFAGLGVAMANSVDDVKKHANYVTLSNDEEGIYECLKILSEKGEI